MRLPVTLTPRPSRSLGGALVLAHGVVALGIVPTSLPIAFRLGLWLILLLSLVVALRRYVLRPPLLALTLKADGLLEAERRDGTRIDAAVHPQTTVFSWLVVLLLRTPTATLALTLPPDALDVEAHRQLRLWLRWKAAVSAA